ncbi:MAG: hydroxymethylglutaryl-CoA lyase, partial [Solirubrobacterales bacterium]|nr:hydroxymethylglutaryl-CoA lyase [Solirubrobacterales bacterium]
VPATRVLDIAAQLVDAGCQEIGFGDTTGMANPRQVEEFFPLARDELADVQVTAHFHNTRGQGLANVLAALQAGVDSFESSFGELGGCPVPPGATGNIASEDLVSMLEEMGISTGIDLRALIEASRAAQAVLGRPLGSHVLSAGPVVWEGEGSS